MGKRKLFERKQKYAAKTGAVYYGDGGTIHSTNLLHVETCNGRVVSVWFRCLQLPFEEVVVNEGRAQAMSSTYLPILTGVEVKDNV